MGICTIGTCSTWTNHGFRFHVPDSRICSCNPRRPPPSRKACPFWKFSWPAMAVRAISPASMGRPSFKLMEERYHRHSTIITTNLVYDEWHNFLGNKSMVEALLSRVRHYCHTVTIDGPSLRDPQG